MEVFQCLSSRSCIKDILVFVIDLTNKKCNVVNILRPNNIPKMPGVDKNKQVHSLDDIKITACKSHSKIRNEETDLIQKNALNTSKRMISVYKIAYLSGFFRCTGKNWGSGNANLITR